ncbi:hypothetical protein B0J12DRAFT_659553 [Macrophomina phaseolina]|uniref:Uncharacterized protein n=1 Tax=Macrophomina phaseolina TaxID=35725 RepID=A0ABQ8GEG3_9PEZI|nr:hypothetical protein B0J12DRAFT_659553 [Macrophomina phaseolina]
MRTPRNARESSACRLTTSSRATAPWPYVRPTPLKVGGVTLVPPYAGTGRGAKRRASAKVSRQGRRVSLDGDEGRKSSPSVQERSEKLQARRRRMRQRFYVGRRALSQAIRRSRQDLLRAKAVFAQATFNAPNFCTGLSQVFQRAGCVAWCCFGGQSELVRNRGMRGRAGRHATVYWGRMWGRRATLCLVRAAGLRAIRQGRFVAFAQEISGGTLSRRDGERWARRRRNSKARGERWRCLGRRRCSWWTDNRVPGAAGVGRELASRRCSPAICLAAAGGCSGLGVGAWPGWGSRPVRCRRAAAGGCGAGRGQGGARATAVGRQRLAAGLRGVK